MGDSTERDESFSMDTRRIDNEYKPFPTFEEWARTPFDVARWNAFTSEMQANRNEASRDILERAQEIVERAAAWDTGAIEGLYETDRGFTYSVARQITTLESIVAQKGIEARNLFESQLDAYDMVLDFATQRQPIAEAWIRSLHAEICKAQDTYPVQTPRGPQQQRLPKGEYKIHPNHVRGRDGEIHAYAPVDLTSEEMHRLCKELESDEFKNAHPALQASYAHYAFVVIHPFADGNGRVARALASVFTYRSHSVPLLILADTREQYLSVLAQADKGEFLLFVRYITERALDGIQLIKESMDAASTPVAEDTIARLRGLYVTKGGYTHEAIDAAGNALLDAYKKEEQRQLLVLGPQEHLSTSALGSYFRIDISDPNYRFTIGGQKNAGFALMSDAPATATVRRQIVLTVPRDANEERGPRLTSKETQESLQVRVEEVFPAITAAAQMRLSIFVERVLGGAMAELEDTARASLRQSGY